jgi:hypothetical protein
VMMQFLPERRPMVIVMSAILGYLLKAEVWRGVGWRWIGGRRIWETIEHEEHSGEHRTVVGIGLGLGWATLDKNRGTF